jgi:prophage tail gpP-like protein
MILKINDRIKIRKIEFFSDFDLELRYDTVASIFNFSFYFDPKNQEHKELACVSHFHECSIEHNGELLVSGFIISESFTKTATPALVSFSGYSKAGVLEDCEIPVAFYPLQSDGLSLRQIASKFLDPFKLKMVVDAAVASRMDKVYKSSTANQSQSIKNYLTELATQRNIVISHNEEGSLLFTEAKAKQAPIMHYEEGLNATQIDLNFNGQGLHSDITVMKQADSDGGNAGQYTIKNPYVPIVYRPRTIIQTSGDDLSTKEAARNALAAELKNIKLTIETDRWEIDGKILKPNSIVSVTAPECYLYKKTNFFVESTRYRGNSKSLTATLSCVLPEVYNGLEPKNVFVDVHKNSA